MAHDEAMTERKEGRTRTKRRTRKASPKKWTKRKEGVERSRRQLVFLCSLPPFPPPHRPALKLSVYKFDVTSTLTKQEIDNQVVHRTQARVENMNQDLYLQVPRKFSGFLFRFFLSDQKRERMWYSGRTVPCQRARKSSLALSCRTEQTRVRFTACVFFFVFASLRIHEVEEEERKLFFFAFVSNRRIPLLSFLFYKGRQLAATL